MNQNLLKHVAKRYLRKAPDIRPGHTVRVHQRIREGSKERVQAFEGLVIKKDGGTGTGSTITVRKILSGVGIEKIFPLHSGNIVKIEVMKRGKVRRSKLYYMRKRSGKSARLRETRVDFSSDMEKLEPEETIQKKTAENSKKKADENKSAKKTEQEAEKNESAEKMKQTKPDHNEETRQAKD